MASKRLAAAVEGALERLSEVGYAPSTLKRHRANLNAFVAYAEAHDEDEWSEELVRGFLLERHAVDVATCERLENVASEARRSCEILGAFMATGEIPGRRRRLGEVPGGFGPLLELYVADCLERGLSVATMRNAHYELRRLFGFLERSGIRRIADIDRDVMALFLEEVGGASAETVRRILGTARSFLRSMFALGVTERDLSVVVPKGSPYPHRGLAKIWTREEVAGLLGSIDRSDATGKRDYAMLLLVATYGLRSGDVVGMELRCLDWGAGELRLVQRKTVTPNTLPLTDDVGWAIADWLRDGRPAQAACDNVFTRLRAPFTALSSIQPVLAARMRAAGIDRPAGVGSGPHSLRHSVASGMLSSGFAVPVISSVLGHSCRTTTMIYLHSDIEELRRCALDLEAVEHGR